MKARNIITGEELDLSKYSEIEFETNKGLIRVYMRNNTVHITANDSIVVYPKASNVVEVDLK